MSTRRKKAKGKRGARSAGAALPLGAAVGVTALRLWTGGFFLVTAWWKLVEEGYSVGEKMGFFREEYVAWIQRAIQRPPELFGTPLTAYSGFLESVMLPAAPVLAPLILLFEAVLGISLVLGAGVRLTASLGLLMMLAFDLAKPQPGGAETDPVGVFLFTVHSANWPVTLILLLLALVPAGRVFGLDTWIRARGPRWLRWIG